MVAARTAMARTNHSLRIKFFVFIDWNNRGVGVDCSDDPRLPSLAFLPSLSNVWFVVDQTRAGKGGDFFRAEFVAIERAGSRGVRRQDHPH